MIRYDVRKEVTGDGVVECVGRVSMTVCVPCRQALPDANGVDVLVFYYFSFFTFFSGLWHGVGNKSTEAVAQILTSVSHSKIVMGRSNVETHFVFLINRWTYWLTRVAKLFIRFKFSWSANENEVQPDIFLGAMPK